MDSVLISSKYDYEKQVKNLVGVRIQVQVLQMKKLMVVFYEVYMYGVQKNGNKVLIKKRQQQH